MIIRPKISRFLGGAPRGGGSTPVEQHPSRTLDAEFVVSETRPAFVSYTVRLGAAVSLSGNGTAEVQLLSGGAVAARARVARQVLLGISIELGFEDDYQITHYVPAGEPVQLVTNKTGTGTAELIDATEVLL